MDPIPTIDKNFLTKMDVIPFFPIFFLLSGNNKLDELDFFPEKVDTIPQITDVIPNKSNLIPRKRYIFNHGTVSNMNVCSKI